MNKLILATILVFSFVGVFAQGSSTTELMKIMNQSDISYEISVLDKDVTRKDMSKNLTTNDFYQQDERGKTTVKQYNISTKEADQLLKEKDYIEARKAYMKILNQEPLCAKAMTGMGQAFELEGDMEKAEKWFTKAVNQNFHDYKAHYALANIYLKQKNKEKAATEITIAHILNRNNKTVKSLLDNIYAATGRKVASWEVVPQCEVKKVEAKKVTINVKTEWLNYAIPMAARNHEPSLKGKTEMIDIVKEGLISMYPNLLRNPQLQQQTSFKYLKKSLEQQQLDSFGYYEIVLVEEPETAFKLSKETIEHIGEYLMKTRSLRL